MPLLGIAARPKLLDAGGISQRREVALGFCKDNRRLDADRRALPFGSLPSSHHNGILVE